MTGILVNHNDVETGNSTEASPSPSPSFGRLDLLSGVLIVLAVLVTGGRGITAGGLGWSDAPNHTFDGIFILEFVKDVTNGNVQAFEPDSVQRWAEQFYLKHPTLGIVVYWPPGFAIIEAAVFGVFGVSVAAARATVLLFAIGAALLMYALGKRLFDRTTGLLAALLLITCPHGVLWLNDVMLEWPATFWILAALYAYQADDGPLCWRVPSPWHSSPSRPPGWSCPSFCCTLLSRRTAGDICCARRFLRAWPLP
jgi:hypothetical protein